MDLYFPIGTCGAIVIRGEIRFICKEDTGDLGYLATGRGGGRPTPHTVTYLARTGRLAFHLPAASVVVEQPETPFRRTEGSTILN